MSATPRQFLASSPRGLADLLASELAGFGAQAIKERSAGVAFAGDLRVAYRACLESRVANRVFLEIARFEAADAAAFYAAVRAIEWTAHLGPDTTLACEFSGRHPSITNTHFGALRLKDAIVDHIRAATGSRPDVALQRPGVRVHAHAQGTNITVSLDLAGESLHRRGYREEGGEAPLKENVAAGILLRAGWETLTAQGAAFLDPMCGSGTLVIEAALIAARRAPGLGRTYYGFLGWRAHDAPTWQDVCNKAEAAARAAPEVTSSIRGQDRDAGALRLARANAERAGVAHLLTLEIRPLSAAAPLDANPGLLCVNPPYGVRLEDHEAARATYRELGAVLRERFQGWTAAVLIGAPDLGMELGLRAYRSHAIWNGGLECRLLRLRIDAQSERTPGSLARPDPAIRESSGARMFANRLTKNLKRLQSWARREGISCYRAYDADMPEYAFAIDRYHTIEPDEDWLYVQEYAAPADIELESLRRRRAEALSVLPEVTGVPPERIRVRTRRRTRRGDQYRKADVPARFHQVMEGGLKLQVNFDEYLDTGLFLDHRLTRARLRAVAKEKRFLNLFAYTGSATVYAAAGGASSTTSVDLSSTYLDWAQRNLAINGFADRRHELVQADCREWLTQAIRRPQRYDLVFLDPPTFSNSKRMQGVLDIERDHAQLIDQCAQLLAADGLLVFSTNAQRFRLEPALSLRYAVKDISRVTLPEDFARNPRIHRCFEIQLARVAQSLYSAGSLTEDRCDFPPATPQALRLAGAVAVQVASLGDSMQSSGSAGPVVAIVGATGAVGVELLGCLERRAFPVGELRLLASARSVGKSFLFRGKSIPVQELTEASLAGVNIGLYSAGSSISKRFAPIAVKQGAIVVDNSSAFRMDPAVPLVVPEINPAAIREHRGIIANPNCAAIISITPLWPIHRHNRIQRLVIATYQAASGAGAAAMEELRASTRAHLEGREYQHSVLPHPYAFNLFSHNTRIDPESGYNEEETKVMQETRKIFGDAQLRVSATCVRVPVLRAHCVAMTFECERPITAAEVRELLASAPGVRLVDDPARNYFPMPKDASGQDDILVGRIRQDVSDPSGHSIAMFVAGDQLLKGAALNAVQIAEQVL